MATKTQEKIIDPTPLLLLNPLMKRSSKGDVEENKNAEFKSQFQFIGLFFAEPHDFTSRIWGSVVKSLTDEFKRRDENAFQPIIVPMLCKSC